MAENPETFVDNNDKNSQKPIETVVNSIMKSQAKEKTGEKEGKTYEAIFNNIKQVLSDLDLSIGDCKKYNQAKIHRKYEIRIADLQNQVSILKNKLREQQNARSPSKKYVQDLVDQLVLYKFQNERLKAENERLINLKNTFQQKIIQNNPEIVQDSPIPNVHKSQNKSSNTKDTANVEVTLSQQKFDLKAEVSNYLRKQQNIRKITEEPKSKFEYFLKKRLAYLGQWTFLEFLSEINKWYVQYYNANQQKLSSRIRCNVLSTFQDETVQKKLPKISNPVNILRSFPQMVGGSGTELKKITKKRESHKSRHNFSTIEVISGARQKYGLK